MPLCPSLFLTQSDAITFIEKTSRREVALIVCVNESISSEFFCVLFDAAERNILCGWRQEVFVVMINIKYN